MIVMKIKVYSDEKKCGELWTTYSRGKSIWDLWEIRKILADSFRLPYYFVTAEDKGEMTAVLPLALNADEKRFEWIGAGWAEGNYPFCEDPNVVNRLLEFVEGKICLEAIKSDDVRLFGTMLLPDHDHYGLDLHKTGGSWEGYLETLKGKKRYNVRRDIRRIESLEPVVAYDNPADLEVMFDLNVGRMREKARKYLDEERSSYEGESADRIFIRKLWQQGGGAYRARLISVKVGGKLVAVDLNLAYGKTYISLVGGLDVERVDGIGSYMNMLDIKDAGEMGCDYVDFCMEGHHWKDSWFEGDKMFKFVRN